MSKKKRQRGRADSTCPMDKHHLLFQRTHWSKNHALLLRRAFVRSVPIEYHRELHALLHDVPLPDSELLRAAWNEYKANQREIDEFDVCRALAWLYVAIPDVDFRQAMQIQLDFFAQKLGGSH